MKRIFLVTILSVLCCAVFGQTNYASFVNPFIGTGGHGHTYPGATLPHGMVQLSPDTRLDGWDGCGGYHYSDHYIYGFSHTHLSGTGVSDYGDILVAPMSGKPSPDNKMYGSNFDHASEKASAGFYSVHLQDDDIDAALTATTRVGFHHYTFNKKEAQYIILDLKHRDEVLESSLKIEDKFTISGLRRSKAWATNQYVYFVMKFSRPIVGSGVWKNDLLQTGNTHDASGKNLKAFFQFDTKEKDLLVKVAISAVSLEGAMKNLAAELPGWDFNATKLAAEKAWNKELSKIEISTTDENKRAIFYTALYHTAVVPNINMDVDGSYRGRDNAIHKAEGFTNYSVFSLWDTYRAANPLYTLIDRERTLDYIKTFLAQYQQGGRLPVWELASNETDCMIGYHSIPVIVDAYNKGIRDFDTKLALEAMKKSATWNHLGLPAYISNGVISIDDEHESVSKTLEYAYDDWCIAIFAKQLGDSATYKEYIQRAQYYKNTLDLNSGFMRPRKNGGWLQPFDPREVNNNFTEANSWQYSFYFPQDISGYLKLTGGAKNLETKLDSLFSTSSQTTGRDQSDITGLIGQYAHGNEPSHHIIYLYDFAGRPDKAQGLIHKVMNEFYTNAPDGLIGNEDCGQMSAWYVWSALGFYPVTPGTGKYMLGTPAFANTKIHLENGKTFNINAAGISNAAHYVQSVNLVPARYSYSNRAETITDIQHSEILKGGVLSFKMIDKPVPDLRKTIPSYGLANLEKELQIVINPVINGGDISFKKTKSVSISAMPGLNIYYSMDGSVPTNRSLHYTKPLQLTTSLTLKAIAENAAGKTSLVSSAEYFKVPNEWSLALNNPYERQFDGGGKEALIDGVHGSVNWRKGNWQGYQKNDVDVVIDLKETKTISEATVGFLQDSQAWIIMPKQVKVFTSLNGKDFTEVYSGENFLPAEDLHIQVKKVEARFAATAARYVKVVAIQFGKMPAWHEGAGGDTHIFVDEIEIK
ncbi:MAG: alpha-mannosidase [Ferruginibacter sp.]|nr:alpha-mannosidase [Ferruginibacter sp.]